MGDRRDDTVRIYVIDSCQSLTLACPFISEQFVAFLAAAFEGAHCVPAEVITAAIVLQAFIDVWVEKTRECTALVKAQLSPHASERQLVW